ncbi:hypothetical protein TNCV_2760741 [Trichonephila clavipes]|nr:hypothetical protein TNCV_2760741 [Trichonephila clavipes]
MMSPKLNPNITMLQAEAGFVSKHNAVPFCRSMPTVHHTIVGENVCGFYSRVNEAVEALWTFYFAANGVQ